MRKIIINWQQKLLKKLLCHSITLLTLILLLLALSAELIRDVSIFWALSLYLPLLLLGLWAIVWDFIWRGKSLVMPYALTMLGFIAISVQTSQLLHFHLPQPVPQQAQTIRLLHWNTLCGGKWLFNNQPHSDAWRELSATIALQQTDIIILSEPPQDARLNQFVKQLGDNWQILSFKSVKPCRRCKIMFSVLSKYAIQLERYVNLRHGDGFIVQINLPQQTLRVLVVDGVSKYNQLRTPFLQDIYHTIIEQHEKQQPVDVIVGDFNAISRSRGFDLYPSMGYWLAGKKTFGWRGTWKSYLPLLDIDHIWINQNYQAVYTEFLTHHTTDHRGQLVTFYPINCCLEK